MRWESGESAYRISESLGGRPTRQAIARRVKLEGWEKSGKSLQPKGSDLTSGSQAFRQGVVLEALSRGATYDLAAKSAGISRRTLQNYRSDDADFARACETARAGRLVEYMGTINDAASNGDWKAAAYALERAPETRESFRITDDSGNKLSIVINVPRGELQGEKPAIEGRVERD